MHSYFIFIIFACNKEPNNNEYYIISMNTKRESLRSSSGGDDARVDAGVQVMYGGSGSVI
jgi:hypothetical protein